MKSSLERILSAAVAALVLTICFAACSAAEPSSSGAGDGAETVAAKPDVDLTVLSSTVAYAQFCDMMANPGKYEGKTVRAAGPFAVLYGSDPDACYPSVLLTDATGCCSVGVEFLLKGGPAYPEGYPDDGDEVTVRGVFATYFEGERKYCRLAEAELETAP